MPNPILMWHTASVVRIKVIERIRPKVIYTDVISGEDGYFNDSGEFVQLKDVLC